MDKPKIVAIDDTKMICDMLSAWLKNDYEVVTFLSGKDGMAYLSENTVNLVLLDYDMPGMTGYEVLMEIRINKKTSKMPVIFLTGVTNERMEQEMLERGANDYIHKPLELGVLRERITKHITSVPHKM